MMVPSKIVVAGSGIIGNSIAYYLAKNHDTAVTLVDPVGVAPAASGKAGGFLARDWSDGTPVGLLQRHSFDLHATLAEELPGGASAIDYRRLTCAAVAVDGSGSNTKPKGKKLDAVEWADMGVVGSRPMGDESTIAQVHPKKLCNALFSFCEEKVGTKLKKGKVVQVNLSKSNEEGSLKVSGVKLESGETLEADAFVVACGPWTDEAKSWFSDGSSSIVSLPSVFGQKYHSILIRSPRVLSQAVFFQGAGDPEVYPRPDGDAYITGFPDSPITVTERPGEESIQSEKVDLLQQATVATSSELGTIAPHTTQSCYLPITSGGIPTIGPIPGITGAYIATGHSCWGITNGPATGEALADLIMHGADSTSSRPDVVDLSSFFP